MQDNSLIFLFHIPKTGGTSLREALSAALGMHDGFIHLGPYGDRVRQEKKLKPLEEYSKDELARIQVLFGHYLSSDFERLFPGRSIKRAILLRDPAERVLSNYNHAMRNRAKLGEKPVDFHTWYEELAKNRFDWPSLYHRKLTLEDKKFTLTSVGHNYMSKFILEAMGEDNYQSMTDEILLSRVTEILNTFWHVGSIENLAPSIEKFENAIGRKLDVGTYNKTGSFSFSRLSRHMKMNDELRNYLVEHNQVDYRIYDNWCKRKASPK